MSYNKTIWKSGDIITTEKWNNLTNNVPGLKIIQIPSEWTKDEEEELSSAKLLITSEQLTNYIKNGYLCYYRYDNTFYYYVRFSKNDYCFKYNTTQRWHDNGNGYLELQLDETAVIIK